MSTLDLCEKFFGKRDFYELLELPKDAKEKDIKKAYYKISLQVHPDRVPDESKEEATEKFKLLSKIYQVLSDKDKRAIYDEKGYVDDDELESRLSNWLEVWRTLFKPLSFEDISNYEKSYQGSELERTDIKKSYIKAKGCINEIMDSVPFLKLEDEDRLQNIVRKMIDDGEVEEFKIFTEEPAAKRSRRHKKLNRQSNEAAKIKEKLLKKQKANSGEDDLVTAMLEKRKQRANDFESLMDNLAQKYAGNDGESIDIKSLGKKRATNKKTPVKGSPTKKLRGVKKGKVRKEKN